MVALGRAQQSSWQHASMDRHEPCRSIDQTLVSGVEARLAPLHGPSHVCSTAKVAAGDVAGSAWTPDSHVGLHTCGPMGSVRALLAGLMDVQHCTSAHTCSAPDDGPWGVVRALLGRLLAVGTTAAGSG